MTLKHELLTCHSRRREPREEAARRPQGPVGRRIRAMRHGHGCRWDRTELGTRVQERGRCPRASGKEEPIGEWPGLSGKD